MSKPKIRRVVITGLGMVTPLGTGVEKTWKAICAGESGVARITKFDPTDCPVQIAGEVKDFNVLDFIEKKEIKKMDPFIHYAVAVSKMAVEDASLRITSENATRVGVKIGSGIGGLGTIEHYHSLLKDEGFSRITPFFFPAIASNLAPAQVAIHLGARGPNSCTVTACATGTHCIGDAYRIIQRDEADVMVAGGTEAPITPLGVAGFAAARALSRRNHEPERASRPFDKDRDGFVLAEGAGVVVLEELEHARRREARIFCEISGYGQNSDAYHITAPSENGEGAVRCMELAIMESGLGTTDIDYVNAHATSTMADAIETQAIKQVLGDHAYKIPVSATKSLIGHSAGAAGGIEAVVCALTIHRGVIPPTINLEYPDPTCDLDYVPNKAREASVNVILKNSFGFGGVNACLVFKRLDLESA